MDQHSRSSSPDSLKKVGKITSVHGLKGELYVFVFSGEAFWSDEIEEFSLSDGQGRFRSFTVRSVREHKKGLLIQTEEIRDRTAAEAVLGHEFWIDSELFVSEPGETIFLGEVEGFEVHDETHGAIGPVVGFVELPGQDLLVVQRQNHKVEIPFVDAFIDRIEFEEKRIYMKLPEGLLELFEQETKGREE